jgi:CTP synthase
MGGTMRLGAYECTLKRNSLTHTAYQKTRITERHRHRYEFNNEFRNKFEKKGMLMSGINPETDLVEIIELKDHPYFIGTQFHPEYKSTVENPHPLFLSFINAAFQQRAARENQGSAQPTQE